MAPDTDDHGWERRCGEHGIRLERTEDDVRTLFTWKDHHEADSQRRHLTIMERLTSVETKLIFFAAIAAALGSMLPNVFAALIKHL
mgnify:CR=1 FL=1